MSRRRLRPCPAHWPVRFAASQHTTAEGSARQTEDFESLARLAEDSTPSFKKEEERQFLQRSCTGLPPSSAWRSEESMVRRSRQDIAEYAVMLAAILVSVSARYGSLDQNCVTALQQHKVFETISVAISSSHGPKRRSMSRPATRIGESRYEFFCRELMGQTGKSSRRRSTPLTACEHKTVESLGQGFRELDLAWQDEAMLVTRNKIPPL